MKNKKGAVSKKVISWILYILVAIAVSIAVYFIARSYYS
jgi:hypothetical protein